MAPSAFSMTRALALAGAALCAAAPPPASAAGATVSVTLNGAPLAIAPPPIERAGRVFVPLRGVFQNLGASVVYADRTINAQRNDTSISLRVGSNEATVNGRQQALDVAPFIVGASTYVPLRFVSQALGASVNFDAANKIVAISNGGAPPAAAAATTTPAAGRSALRLEHVEPGRDVSVDARRPTVAAQFAGAQADPNSLRVTLDDLDITASTSRSASGFVYSPPSDLQSMRHEVRVRGTDTTGAAFDFRWRFTSGTSSAQNRLQRVSPADGASVGSQFTVSGTTLPGATVIVQVGAASGNPTTIAGAVGTILGLGGGANVRNEVTANADGSFSTVVAINAPSGTTLQLVVSSTDPRTKAAAPSITRTLTVR